MNYLKLVKELQTHFFQQASGFENYKFKANLKDIKTIVNFIKWGKEKYKKEFDVDFLIRYFEFQYSYYSGLQTKFGKGVVMFNWIVGPKAVQRFEDRDISKNKSKKFFLNKNSLGHLKKLYISSVEKEKIKQREKFLLKINPLEERFKEAFFNSEKGFVFCCNQTTLYNGKSNFCRKCLFSSQCKETLKVNYPTIFNLRKKYGAIR